MVPPLQRPAPLLLELSLLLVLLKPALPLDVNIALHKTAYAGSTAEVRLTDGNETTCSQESTIFDVHLSRSTKFSWIRTVGAPNSVLHDPKVTFADCPDAPRVIRSRHALTLFCREWTASQANVRLRYPGSVRLCEIEVYSSSLLNVALGKQANQSSTFDGWDSYQGLSYKAAAGLAVDGAPTKEYKDKTCAVTDWLSRACTNDPWWQVDLEDQYDVSRVDIYPRNAQGLLYVRLADTAGREVEKKTVTASGNSSVSVSLSPLVRASTVNISLRGCTILQLCEVEIFAVPYKGECQRQSPCQNRGRCINTPGSYTCQCTPGFTGHHCSSDVDECELQSPPCQNGGSCTNTAGSYTCQCTPGYTGHDCSSDVDECSRPKSPCQNGGSCTNTAGSYTCQCTAGYTGHDCSSDVDECKLQSPCQNGGSCTNTNGSYTCQCTPGYTGHNCSSDVDECKRPQSPCQNGGSCTNTPGSYTCQCTPGFTGPHCSSDVDECASDPCRFGLCEDRVNSYSCRCLAGLSGPNCDVISSDGKDRGLGLYLGIGLGLFLLLLLVNVVALVVFCRRRNAASSGAVNDRAMEIESRDKGRDAAQGAAQASISIGTTGVQEQDADMDENIYEKVQDYEPLDDETRTKPDASRAPYVELESASRSRGVASLGQRDTASQPGSSDALTSPDPQCPDSGHYQNCQAAATHESA